MNWTAEKLAQQQWYTQGIPGKPIYLTGMGGINAMQAGTGFSYEAIMGVYFEDYCEWNYLVSDLEAHYKTIFEYLKNDPYYLKKMR